MRVAKTSSPIWFSLCSFIITLVAQAAFPQADVYKKFTGEYITGHNFGGGSITLNLDGTFSEGGGSDDGTLVWTKGTYRLLDCKLLFQVTISTLKRGDAPEVNLLDPVEVQKRFGPGETPAKKEFVRIPIEWTGRIYLVPEDEMNRFADAVNLGIEPRPALFSDEYMGSPWLGSFYMRKGDEKIKTAGLPPIPKPWSDLLLARPVIAKVIKINTVEKGKFDTIFIATINKGSRHGLKQGMKLVTGNEDLSPWWGTEVVAVQVNTAQIKVTVAREILKVGDKVTSIYKSRYLIN